jgi:hypothetical protein
MSFKIFASHSWQDAHLVQELRRMLDGSELSYEITSVESSNPINFPKEIAENKLALDAISRSIRELELHLEVDICHKAGIPSICVDAPGHTSGSRPPTGQYIS